MNRYVRALLIALPVAGLIVVAEAAYQNKTDLPGGTYKTHKLKSSAKPAACEALCEKDATCKAWTFVKGDLLNAPRCRLKNIVPQAVQKNCCTSGVKVASTPPPQPEPPKPERNLVWHVEPNTDRNGGDYDYADLAASYTWENCQALCAGTWLTIPSGQTGKCKAWTFAKAGVFGPTPRCWLKSTVPMIANQNTNAVSGYVTGF